MPSKSNWARAKDREREIGKSNKQEIEQEWASEQAIERTKRSPSGRLHSASAGLIEWRWGRAIFSWKWQLEMNWKFRNWKFRIGSLESLKLKVNYKTATVSHRAADHQIEPGFNSRHPAESMRWFAFWFEISGSFANSFADSSGPLWISNAQIVNHN